MPHAMMESALVFPEIFVHNYLDEEVKDIINEKRFKIIACKQQLDDQLI
jgi:hypothetical protein